MGQSAKALRDNAQKRGIHSKPRRAVGRPTHRHWAASHARTPPDARAPVLEVDLNTPDVGRWSDCVGHGKNCWSSLPASTPFAYQVSAIITTALRDQAQWRRTGRPTPLGPHMDCGRSEGSATTIGQVARGAAWGIYGDAEAKVEDGTCVWRKPSSLRRLLRCWLSDWGVS